MESLNSRLNPNQTTTRDKKIQNLVVLGIFDTREAVEEAVSQFKSQGFRNADISALFPTGTSNKEFAHEAGTKLPEGATTGGATGAVLGGVLGWLAGVGALAIPGVGPLVAAGPIMALLAGASVGGAVGGVAGGLIGWGIPEYEAKRYEGQIKNGGILVSVHCDDSEWVNRAKRIFEDGGAHDVSSTSEESADSAKSNRPYPLAGNL